MTDPGMTIEIIERGLDDHPTCQCGRPTTAVVHGDAMWVECTALSQPVDGRFRRLVSSMTAPLHYRDNLGEVLAA